MHYVLDACALLAFLRGEEGADKIETLLLDNNRYYIFQVIAP